MVMKKIIVRDPDFGFRYEKLCLIAASVQKREYTRQQEFVYKMGCSNWSLSSCTNPHGGLEKMTTVGSSSGLRQDPKARAASPDSLHA